RDARVRLPHPSEPGAHDGLEPAPGRDVRADQPRRDDAQQRARATVARAAAGGPLRTRRHDHRSDQRHGGGEMTPRLPHLRDARGVTLVELLAALVVISVGVLALVRVFPTASSNQVEDRLLTSANLYAQEKLEDLSPKSWIDAALTAGRHPASSTNDEVLGTSGRWHRYSTVTTMAAPLDNLKKVTVTVYWTFMGSRTVNVTTYLRR